MSIDDQLFFATIEPMYIHQEFLKIAHFHQNARSPSIFMFLYHSDKADILLLKTWSVFLCEVWAYNNCVGFTVRAETLRETSNLNIQGINMVLNEDKHPCFL